MSIKPSVRFSVLRRDHFTCRYYGRRAPSIILHVDHVVSRYDGGSDDPSNLVAACKDCNLGKFNRSVRFDPLVPDGPLEFRIDPELSVRHDLPAETRLLLAIQTADDIAFCRYLRGRDACGRAETLEEALCDDDTEEFYRIVCEQEEGALQGE